MNFVSKKVGKSFIWRCPEICIATLPCAEWSKPPDPASALFVITFACRFVRVSCNAYGLREKGFFAPLLRWGIAAQFHQDWRARHGRVGLAATAQSRGGIRSRPVTQGGNHDLPAGRTAASGYFRPETG